MTSLLILVIPIANVIWGKSPSLSVSFLVCNTRTTWPTVSKSWHMADPHKYYFILNFGEKTMYDCMAHCQ